MEGYNTVLSQSTAEYTEKRSRFIAYAYPCGDEEQAVRMIREARTQHWDARHHVYAYILRENGTKRFSDDGEPHGTAGKPILDVLEGRELYDVLVIVVRYFGGTLLGTGGLVKAYGTAASEALRAAEIAEMQPCVLLETVCGYAGLKGLERLIDNASGIIEDTTFTEDVKVTYRIEKSRLPEFEKQLTEAFSARITSKLIGEKLLPLKLIDNTKF